MPSLTQLKERANIARSVDDNELQSFLDAAVAWVSERIGRPLDGATQTFTVYSCDGVLLLPMMGATAVTAVTGPDALAVTVDTRLTNLASGVVVTTARLRGNYTVTVSTPLPIPAPVEEATYIIAAHLVETQRGPAAPTPLDESDFAAPGLGYAIPNRARDLLAPYLPPAVA